MKIIGIFYFVTYFLVFGIKEIKDSNYFQKSNIIFQRQIDMHTIQIFNTSISLLGPFIYRLYLVLIILFFEHLL